MIGQPILTTARLLLRPLQLSDAAEVQIIFPQWEIVRFLATSVPWPYPLDGALTYIRDSALPAMQRGTEWHWSIRRKAEPNRLIGLISLTDRPNNNRGFWLAPDWQRLGLMTEASAAVTQYWFETLDRTLLRAPKAVTNIGSRRISERSGMRVVNTMDQDYVSGKLRTEIWEITREDWRRHLEQGQQEGPTLSE